MEDIYQFLDKLLTAKQQAAFGIITISVLVVTQAFKNIYFGFCPEQNRNRKKAILWLFAFVFGMICGYIGYASVLPRQPLWFWGFSGISSGGMAIGLFWLIKSVIIPRFKK